MAKLKIFRSIKELREARGNIYSANSDGRGKKLGFVPTMGALHEGHLTLVRQSLKECDETWASIFVNPLQFGPNEDLSKYPRPIERDLELLERAGAHGVFIPSVEEMYPAGAVTRVIVGKVSEGLCGKFRPGHFEGVATVVAKLFHMVEPCVSYFGQKDYQQCAVIESMVRDLNFPTGIKIVPTVREADGLAMSSRNMYLSANEREKALVLFRALSAIQNTYRDGISDVETMLARGNAELARVPEFKPQYLEVVHPKTLDPLRNVGADGAVALVAGYLGTTRLIDNFIL